MGVVNTLLYSDSPHSYLALGVGSLPLSSINMHLHLGKGGPWSGPGGGGGSPFPSSTMPTLSYPAFCATPNSWLPFAGKQGPWHTWTWVAGATLLTFHFMKSDLVTFWRGAWPGPASPPPLVGGLDAYNTKCVKSFLHQNTDSYTPLSLIPNIQSLVRLLPPPPSPALC